MAYDTTLSVALTTQASILEYLDKLSRFGKAEGLKQLDALRAWVITSNITAMKFSPLADFDNNTDQAFDAISNGATTLYGVYIDNSANTGTAYVKLYNDSTANVGVDSPDVILFVPGTTTGAVTGEGAYDDGRYWHVFVPGVRFATNIGGGAVTTAAVGGVTDPTSTVNGMLIHT